MPNKGTSCRESDDGGCGRAVFLESIAALGYRGRGSYEALEIVGWIREFKKCFSAVGLRS